jgi:ABC-type nitrate/sulfonate/bicarbonate transport system ATPase subunit
MKEGKSMFLNCNDINFAYTSNKKVLNGISFSLEKGKTLAIVGASGCGKSTLLRILSGILKNANGNSLQGKVEIDGITSDQYRQTGKLAFMFQEATLMPHLTVKQNIELPLKIKGQSNEQKTSDLIKAVGLTEYANYLPKQLSGGMRTRVALARAFVTEPELLLLDEPFSALDIGWRSDLYKTLISLFHTTLVFVTHDVQEAILLADEIIMLNRKGVVQAKLSVKTKKSIYDRVHDIPGFVNDEAFKDFFPALQQAIILEEIRGAIDSNKLNEILHFISNCAGSTSKENLIQESQLNPIREFANSERVNSILVDVFVKAQTYRLKYMLLWDILEYSNLSNEAHQQYFDYYMGNVSQFAEKSREWYSAEGDKSFFQILKGRIETLKGYNQKKKWIYICDLYSVRNLPDLIPFLDEIINGKIEEVNFPLAIKAANLVKANIKNEKQDTIHLA